MLFPLLVFPPVDGVLFTAPLLLLFSPVFVWLLLLLLFEGGVSGSGVVEGFSSLGVSGTFSSSSIIVGSFSSSLTGVSSGVVEGFSSGFGVGVS